MTPQDHPTGVQLRLYVRSLVPRGRRSRQTAVDQRLAALAQEGRIGGYDVVVCGRQLPASPSAARTDIGAALATDVAVFREWARRNDCSLQLRDRTVDNRLTGERYESIEWPQLLLVEYRETDLAAITPVETDQEVVTVEDHLDALEAGASLSGFTPVKRSREPAETPQVHPSNPS